MSAKAILALNRGARDRRFCADTGRRPSADTTGNYRRDLGMGEIGSGYFGCRMAEATSTRSDLPKRTCPDPGLS